MSRRQMGTKQVCRGTRIGSILLTPFHVILWMHFMYQPTRFDLSHVISIKEEYGWVVGDGNLSHVITPRSNRSNLPPMDSFQRIHPMDGSHPICQRNC